MNETANKFGYPGSVVKRFDHWAVLLRPAQPTLGSLVLVCADPVERFGQISESAAAELRVVISETERVLDGLFSFEKINYLMLMMVDPDVHFHVLPRYSEPKSYAGKTFVDDAWPGPPDITAANEFPDEVRGQMIDDLRARYG